MFSYSEPVCYFVAGQYTSDMPARGRRHGDECTPFQETRLA